ncbi:group 1 truncated hemoglobin [Sedimentitalea sp. CY04]|uniref:Group 1 truncated hemoglobin n=1 Tax=Parasedimentitalea denitrificans TaxID=2211118 RepID=A0ABX0W9E7_9RHOB|nr:group 1 truncated hemoglobin [Sedimentitalea sp. CY04]NIZ62276.1 group 1 truncated hemoglobin [Sedimentitalea sp. CY04]
MAGTIYEKYGGFKTVSRIVMAFYDKALDSDQIGDYFVDVDLSQLIDHQTKFISSLLGGPVSFSDDQLHRVHRQLEICHADFDEMVSLLAGTLVDHGMARDDVETVIGEIEARRKMIVSIGS